MSRTKKIVLGVVAAVVVLVIAALVAVSLLLNPNAYKDRIAAAMVDAACATAAGAVADNAWRLVVTVAPLPGNAFVGSTGPLCRGFQRSDFSIRSVRRAAV